MKIGGFPNIFRKILKFSSTLSNFSKLEKISIKNCDFFKNLTDFVEKFAFLGGTPLLNMLSTLGYYDPFFPRT